MGNLLWWSCGESHPGPKGNWLFVYKHSLSWVFTTHDIKDKQKMIGCRVEKFPSPTPLRIGSVSDINMTPFTGMSPAGKK